MSIRAVTGFFYPAAAAENGNKRANEKSENIVYQELLLVLLQLRYCPGSYRTNTNRFGGKWIVSPQP